MATTSKSGNNVHALRTARGMTLMQLAALTGVTLSHISHIEHSRTRVRRDMADKLAAALGVTVDELFPDKASISTLEKLVPKYPNELRRICGEIGLGVMKLCDEASPATCNLFYQQSRPKPSNALKIVNYLNTHYGLGLTVEEVFPELAPEAGEVGKRIRPSVAPQPLQTCTSCFMVIEPGGHECW